MPDGLEAEKKFFPTPTLVSTLRAHADSITETHSTDIILQTEAYNNMVLRQR